MNRLTASFALSLLILCSCGEKGSEDGSFIQTRGTYELGKGASLEIFRDENDLMDFRHTRRNGNMAEWVDGIVAEESSWFVYVVDFDEVWLATGSDLIFMYEGDEVSGSISIFSCRKPVAVNQTIYEKMPGPVMSMLGSKLKSRIQEARKGEEANQIPQ